MPLGVQISDAVSKWLEFHTERQYGGGYAGVSVRVARGVSLRTGSTGGRSRSVEVAKSTPGRVYLSDRRIIFISPVFSREIRLKSALHFGKGPGFIHIDLPNASSIQVETGNNGLSITLDKILSGAAQTDTADPASPQRAIPTHAATPLGANIGTKKWVVDQLLALLDKTFPVLQGEYDAARTSPLAPAGPLLTQQRSVAWIREKIALLSTLGQTATKIAVTDLATALSAAGDVEQASAAQEKWVHECSTFCYQLIDWEPDVKTANLHPLLMHAQTLMRGVTDA